MKRRAFITKGGILLSTITVGSNFVLTTSCSSDTVAELSGLVSAKEKRLLNELGAIIIPKTDTPGAKEAEIAEYIAVIVEDCYSDEDQEKFKLNLSNIEMKCSQMHNRSFLECSQGEREDLVMALEESDESYRSIKSFITSAYLSSKIGKTEFFDYYQVPGKYDGCSEKRPW